MLSYAMCDSHPQLLCSGSAFIATYIYNLPVEICIPPSYDRLWCFENAHGGCYTCWMHVARELDAEASLTVYLAAIVALSPHSLTRSRNKVSTGTCFVVNAGSKILIEMHDLYNVRNLLLLLPVG